MMDELKIRQLCNTMKKRAYRRDTAADDWAHYNVIKLIDGFKKYTYKRLYYFELNDYIVELSKNYNVYNIFQSVNNYHDIIVLLSTKKGEEI